MKSYYAYLVLFALFVVGYLPRRAKELSTDGRPQLRYYGPGLVAIVSATFWLSKCLGMSPGEAQPRGDDLYVWYIFFGISFVGAVWFLFGLKTTLTEHSVDQSVWPFPTLRYDLRDVVSVRREGFFSMEFARGRRFGVMPVASGRKYFIATLDARLKELGK